MPTVKGIFGQVTARVVGMKVIIEGVRSEFMRRDLEKIFETSRVSNHLVDVVSRNSFAVHQFFLPDFIHCLDAYVSSGKTLRISLRTVELIRKELIEATWIEDVYMEDPPNRLDRSALKDFYKTPLDYQDEFFKHYNDSTYRFHLNGYLFAAAAGGGKSLSALMLMAQLSTDITIIVAPNNAIERVWAGTLQSEMKSQPKFWSSARPHEPFDHQTKYFIVHNEYLSKFINDILPRIRYNNLGIVLDESHNFNEPGSARTQLFLKLCKQTECENVLWLSGTPIKALAVEAIPLLSCFDPLFDEEAQAKYKSIFRGDNTKAVAILNNRIGMVSFTVPKGRLKLEAPIFHSVKVGFKGAEEFTLLSIAQKMRDFILEREIYYRGRRDVDHKFFYEILESHRARLSGKQLAEYEAYRRALASVIRSNAIDCKDDMVVCNRYEKNVILPGLSSEDKAKFKDVKTVVKYVRLKILGECLGRIVGRARIEAHLEMAKHIDYATIIESTPKKTVIFSAYTEVIEQAATTLREREFNPALIYAKTNAQLPAIIGMFETKVGVNPLVATYASLSTAVPLTMADTMIIIDTPFRDYVLQQSVSRIHRLGATTQVNIYTCSLDTGEQSNISTRNIDILRWSQDQVQGITGVSSPYVLEGDEAGADGLPMDQLGGRFEQALEHFNMAIEGLVDEIPTARPKHLNW